MERKQLSSQEEAVVSLENIVIKAVEAGRWMAAVWMVKDGRLFLSGCTTWDFPKADMLPAVDMLREDRQGELNDSPASAFGTALPRAREMAAAPNLGVVRVDDNLPKEEALAEDPFPPCRDPNNSLGTDHLLGINTLEQPLEEPKDE